MPLALKTFTLLVNEVAYAALNAPSQGHLSIKYIRVTRYLNDFHINIFLNELSFPSSQRVWKEPAKTKELYL